MTVNRYFLLAVEVNSDTQNSNRKINANAPILSPSTIHQSTLGLVHHVLEILLIHIFHHILEDVLPISNELRYHKMYSLSIFYIYQVPQNYRKILEDLIDNMGILN